MARIESEPGARRGAASRALLQCVAGAAIYGGVLGSWSGLRMALFASLKLPLLMLATALLTAPLSALVTRACGVPIRLSESALLSLRALGRAALRLASLAPIAALFTWAAPAPGPAERTAHNLLYLTHTLLVGACGVAGARDLRERLRALAPGAEAARRALLVWVALFGLVGGELAWALRPFLGSVYQPVSLLREDALDGNVYEFIWTDIRPHLAARLFRGGSR